MFKVRFIYNGEFMVDTFDTLKDFAKMVYEAGQMGDNLRILGFKYIN